MRKAIIRSIEIALGVTFLVSGVVMLFTPGQGILFIIFGVLLFSPYHGKKLLKHVQNGWWFCVNCLPQRWGKRIRRHIPKNFCDRLHKKFQKFRKKLHR
jgi:hypothetical protein